MSLLPPYILGTIRWSLRMAIGTKKPQIGLPVVQRITVYVIDM